jgi:phage-related protein
MTRALGDKPLVWLQCEVTSAPLTIAGRIKMGHLLRRLQRGESLGLPESRPLPAVMPGCRELRVVDDGSSWRLVYRVDPDAIVIVEVFRKTTRTTPMAVVQACRRRLRAYDR